MTRVRCEVRFIDRDGKRQAFTKVLDAPDDNRGQVSVWWPPDCPWPPRRANQVQVAFSPVRGKKDG